MKIKDQNPVIAPAVVSDVVAFDPKTASASFIISTSNRDRDGDVMLSEGCLDTLDSYKANPVVLFDHGLSGIAVPIGLSEYPDSRQCTVQVEADKITARVFFHCETLECSQIARLTEKNILRAASIGYKGINAEPADPRRPRKGMIYDKWEMVEWSIVPVPANGEALRQALSAKWEGKALHETIAVRFKSLIKPSTKLILPASSSPRRMKAMPDETLDTTAADETSQLPAGAQGIKVLLAGVLAALAQVKEVYPTIEQPQVIKLLDKFIANTEKATADLSNQASSIYPDIFEAAEAAEEEKDDDVSDVGDAEEATDKDKKKSFKGGSMDECSPHINSLKDAAELIDDMSKSANIPSGYKRQCKGVLPGLTGVCSWITGKAETPDEEEKPAPKDDPEPKEEDDDEGEKALSDEILKSLKDISVKQEANAKALKQIKGNK